MLLPRSAKPACQTFARICAIVALLAAPATTYSVTGQIYTVAEAAREIDTQLAEMSKVPPTDASGATSAQTSLEQSLELMRQKSVMIYGERRTRWEAINAQLELALQTWSQAKASEDRNKSLVLLRKTWSALKQQFPAEALTVLPRLWSCPMHGELLQEQAGNCPVCGMSLEPVYLTQPQLTSAPIIRAEVIAPDSLHVGTKADLRLRLTFVNDNSPVDLADLEETHTRKIHLLITEPSETDYHHEHPEPLGRGEYQFSFAPALPGTYRVWADLKPLRTHVQQFAITDIPGSAHANTLQRDEPENRHAEIDGYKFDLSFAKPVIAAKDTVAATVRVTSPDGKPCRNLEVVMGAFGHFVGFGDDFSTVLHMHPVGQLPTSPDSLGGPELPFYFRSSDVGLVRLFAQVKMQGRDFFPRFVIKVQALQHLPGGG